MGIRRLRLSGFESELIAAIAAGFRFSDPSVANVALVPDRNIFANWLPDPADIALTASDADNGVAFDPNREPAIAVYRQPGSGISPSSSSGGRLAFNTLLVIRAPRALQVAVDLLGELVVWLELNAVGLLMPHFQIKGYQTLGMPVPAELLQDEKTKASSTVRFLAIARP